MRKLLLLFFTAILFFIVPAIPIFRQTPVIAATTDYVDSDFPAAMDAAKSAIRDMNAVGHVASVFTTTQLDLVRRTFGPILGLTTNSQDSAYLQQMRQESLAFQSEIILAQIYSNPPASTYAFVRDMGQSLGFIPKSAYAQGIGFSGLSALLPIWKVFRNIAYLLLALFMIVIGFFIMFRKKIDPKTVITVQNALPNIIITLLLITFSYAIVGILIDFMYLIIMIAISILKPVSNGVIDANTVGQFTTGSFVDVGWKLFLGGQDTFFNGILPFLGLKLPDPNTPITIDGVFTFFNPVNIVARKIATSFVPIIGFLLACAFIFAIIRLFFMLISAYIQIITSLLISPFQLLLGAFPGSHAFESWIKNLIANVAVFPITAIMILIGSIIAKGGTGVKLWAPPMLNAGGVEGMTGIIGIGVLLGIPSVVGSIKEALKAKAPIGGARGNITAPFGTAMQAADLSFQVNQLTGGKLTEILGFKKP